MQEMVTHELGIFGKDQSIREQLAEQQVTNQFWGLKKCLHPFIGDWIQFNKQ